MKNDIAKVSFDEMNHFLGVFHQMGRMPLESDFNEQNELVLRLLQRLAGDAVHTGSPNDGFRIDTHVVLDRADSRRGWSATPGTATLFVDYFDHRVGDGSLVVLGATAVGRTLERPLDLGEAREVVVAVKAVPAAPFAFYVRDAAANVHTFTMSDIATDDGWLLVRGVPGAWPAGFVPSRIVEYGFSGLTAATRYAFDVLKAELPLRTVVVDPGALERFAHLPAAAVVAADDDQRLWGASSVVATQASAVSHAFADPIDMGRARALLVAVQRNPAAAAFAVTLRDAATPANALTLGAATTTSVGAWSVLRYALPQAGTFDWTAVTELAWSGLDAAASYHLGPVLLEAETTRDLVIMGGDGSVAGAGRFYGDGLAAVRESHGTYFTQAQLPQADPAALDPVAPGEHRIDWAYLDLWERPLSYVEQPVLREVALEGADTCTRTQLVAQVRLLAGQAVALAATPAPPADAFALLPRIGGGVLSTKDKPAAVSDPCADPCEPAIAGPYLGEENRLFRVEIHRAGGVGAAHLATTAVFKWSRENAGASTALLEDALAAATSALVEKPELFAIGDLVELADDLVELATGPCEDRVGHAAHTRGELRKVATVNLQTRRVSWEDASVVDPAELPFHAALPRPMRAARHAKLTRWDAVAACTPGDIVLADGVVVEFGGSAMRAGDYWLFATRAIDRSVECLIEAPPRGIRHAHHLLAAIHRTRGADPAPEIVFAEDLRPRFAALPTLDASRVAYDPGACAAEHHIEGWDKVATVQQAIDALCRADLTGDLRLHNQLLHGMGVICGLKLRCARDRGQVVIGKGYALDCEGDLLHMDGERAVALVADAQAQGLLDASGSGKVNLWIERDAGGVAVHIEPNVPQNFWDSVLEGTLLKDYWDDVILALVNFLKAQLWPFPDTTLPLSDAHKRAVALLNLVWQLVNSASGPYIYLSRAEHDLLERFHADLQDLLASRTYCAMFDNLQVFPAYPYAQPTGIDTMFGLWLAHRRMKIDPSNTYLVTYGAGTQVQVFDIASRTAVAVTDFPGAANLDVQDVAFNPSGSEMYAVGTLANGANVDSVFATLGITPPAAAGAPPTLAWSAANVICDIRMVTLATHPAQANVVLAIGRHATDATRRGLYRFNPAAVPLAPMPQIVFNATGLFAIDRNGIDAVATENNLGAQSGDYNVLRRMNLNTLATSVPAAFAASGANDANDLLLANGTAYLTAVSGGQSVLLRFALSTQALLGSTVVATTTSLWRLGLLTSQNTLAIVDANTYRLRVFRTDTATLIPNLRVPLQIFPIALAVRSDDRELYALNLGSTVNAVDVAALTAATPSFTAEPPVTLAAYRQQMLKSFTDLVSVLGQYLKDGFCDKFLVECPECGREDKVYLGTIEVRGERVFHICNFSKRHHAKSFRTWGYWLSAVPILPLAKKLFARFCCTTLVP